MRAVVQGAPGGPEVLGFGVVDDPVPGVGEVCVRVRATALNRVDLMQRAGRYPVPPGASPILGLEMAGVVDEVGVGVTGVDVGDRVFGLLSGGGYAERVAVPAAHLMPIPAGWSFAEAAAVPEAFLTAWQALAWLAHLEPGASVLIHAGGSGVGTAAIQLAAARGVTAYVTCSDGKRDACEALGAARAIDYRAERFVDVIGEVTGGTGVDAVIDVIGAPYFEDNLASLAADGTLVLLATMGGSRVEAFDLRTLFRRRLTVVASTLRSRSDAYKALLTADVRKEVLPLLASGTIRPVIDSVRPWTDVVASHRDMEANRNVGKIVLEVD